MRPACAPRAWVFLALLPILFFSAPAVRAGMVDVSGGLWQDFVLVHPTSLAVTDYFATTAGTVTLSLRDQRSLTPQWGQALATLAGSIATADGDRFLLQGASSQMFAIGANERFTTSIYAALTGTGYGAYVLDLRFTPDVAPVPLPPSVWLLLAGIGLLATRLRRTARPEAATGG